MENEPRVGWHVTKVGSFLETVSTTHGYTRMQIFSGSTKNYSRKSCPKDVENTKEYIVSNNLKVYVHSAYIINLSRPYDQIKPAIDCLQWELTNGLACGFSGVVVHVGKSVGMDVDVAIQNMKENILRLKFCKECPLLLETPAGQGTETLTKMESFRDFVMDIPGLGMCVDTCHIYASGYKDILEYVSKCYDTGRLGLIHLNDSVCECGSKKDRHEYPGDGCIGMESLKKVVEYANLKELDCIIEY